MKFNWGILMIVGMAGVGIFTIWSVIRMLGDGECLNVGFFVISLIIGVIGALMSGDLA